MIAIMDAFALKNNKNEDDGSGIDNWSLESSQRAQKFFHHAASLTPYLNQSVFSKSRVWCKMKEFKKLAYSK